MLRLQQQGYDLDNVAVVKVNKNYSTAVKVELQTFMMI